MISSINPCVAQKILGVARTTIFFPAWEQREMCIGIGAADCEKRGRRAYEVAIAPIHIRRCAPRDWPSPWP